MKIIQPRRFHPLKALWVLSVLVAFTVYVTVRDTPGPTDPAWHGETMGTTYSIRLADSPLTVRELKALREDVDACLIEVNRQMSHYMPDSEISQFNRSAAGVPFKVSTNFARVMAFALELNGTSGGAFDPTLGPLIDLWGFGPAGVRTEPPPESAIRGALAQIGCAHLRLTANNELIKDIPGLHLNLGAVAKGFGVDEVARVIQAHGVSNLFVEIGGEVTAFGHNAGGTRWRVGVEAPNAYALPGEEIESVVEISTNAIATSGDYRNFFEDAEGERFSHILDPRTGWPIRHKLASVSVVAPDCMTADGLATTLFVMGEEEGLAWIENVPGADALFIVRTAEGTFTQVVSSGFAEATGYRIP